jgi:hypothetical protein
MDVSLHPTLEAEAAHYALRAGIDKTALYKPAIGVLEADVIEYLKKIKILAKEGMLGLALLGEDKTQHMVTMTAALVRALVDARLMTAAEVLAELKNGGHPEATVLLIPNLFSAEESGKFDQQRHQALGDVITHRAARGMQTVIGIDSMAKFKAAFGERVYSLLSKSYVILGA